MKLYGAPNPAPNPRRVRVFLAEKGVDLPEIAVDMRSGAHKAPEFLAKNPAGQLPVLELDDGRTLSESVAICRYLEALHPSPPLFGRDAFEAAEIDMWVRRVEFLVTSPVGMFWRHAHPFTATLIEQFRDFGESNRANTQRAMQWLDRQLATRDYVAGEGFSMADICALTTVDFAGFIGLAPLADRPALADWRARIGERPSTAA
ncbi:glutathione S-transferase [soil metagenome]